MASQSGANNNKKQGNSSSKPAEKEWHERYDSPIEQSKVHPNLYKWMKFALVIEFFSKAGLVALATGFWDRDGGFWDTIVYSTSYTLLLLLAVFLSIVAVRKEA